MKRSLFGVLAVLVTAACSGNPKAGAGGGATCSNAGPGSCEGGSEMKACVTTTSSGACASTYYTVGSQTFECSSCEDTSCAEKAGAACAGGAITLPGVGEDSGAGQATPGAGGTCSSSQDCPALPCACSDGSSTSYQACTDGVCATSCPSPQGPAGSACFVPGGCFCESATCGFGAETCCATTGTTQSGGACSADCDCQSGNCSVGQCF